MPLSLARGEGGRSGGLRSAVCGLLIVLWGAEAVLLADAASFGLPGLLIAMRLL
ncbi:hypothetical protein ABZ712_31750 [Streptomyces sp. NPDC006906]|uniref:hypothetical protein n=1 Tax=unclassified Streptomyces TaxID=2593676 RepID=UPI0033C18A56